MANARLPLTEGACKRAAPTDREYALHDTRQPGLSLRVQPCGARSWVIRIRTSGRQVRQALGSYPETSIKAARQLANALLAASAVPPVPASTAPLFEIFQIEHERGCTMRLKPAGLRTYRSYMRHHLLPAFAGKRLGEITRPEVICWFERYSAERPGGANRALGILGQMLGDARAWGYLPQGWRNPVTGIRLNRRRKVGTFLGEDQLARLGIAIDARIAQGCMASALLRFLTLTGCRVGEALQLQWGDVHRDRLRLRDSKTGPRDVPIGKPVRQFIDRHRKGLSVEARREAAPVFPVAGMSPYDGVRSIWSRIRVDAALPRTLRIHDLRHSFASHAIMSGETLYCTSKLLGHSRIEMTSRYAHLADTALLEAVERIGTLLVPRTKVSGRKRSAAMSSA